MRAFNILVLVLSVTVVLMAQSPKQHASNKQNAQPQVDKTANHQSISDTGKAPEIQFYTYNNQKEEGDESAKKVGDYLLAAFTFALVIVSLMQWAVLREHEKWMKKNVGVVTEVAEAAKKNAAAALLSAQVVIKSERSWITGSVGDESFRLFRNPAIIPKFWLAIKNSGRTPGKLVRVLVKFEKRDSLNGLRGIEHDLTDNGLIPYVLLVPGEEPFQIGAAITGSQPLGREEMNDIRDSKKFLVAYGVIDYEDVFDFGFPEKKHRSGFFFYYSHSGPTGPGFQTYYPAPPDYLQVT